VYAYAKNNGGIADYAILSSMELLVFILPNIST
jgi:hypothetical protein